ncbi:MAG TPA: type II secretion system F family protein [Bacillales bacterium]
MNNLVAAVVVYLCIFYVLYVLIWEALPRQMIFQRVKGKGTTHREEPRWFRGIAALRDASGLNVSFSQWLSLTLFGIVLGLILGWVGLQNVIVGVLLAATFAALPTWWMNYYAVQHREKVGEGLIPAFETFYSEYTITRNIPRAMEITASQAPEPAKDEFARMARAIYAGQDLPAVLKAFQSRMNNRWVRLFSALLMMREKKGSQIKASLLNMIKEQKRRQMENKKERSEMAQVRLVHLILMLSSIVLFLFNLVIRPASYTFFTASPNGRWVMVCIVSALLVSIAIFMLMNRKEVD